MSKLEKFRRYVDQVTDFDTIESLMDTLNDVYQPNYKAKFGTAYGALITNPEKYYDDNAGKYRVPLTERGNVWEPLDRKGEFNEIGEYMEFTAAQAEPAIRYNQIIRPAFYEVPSYYTINVDGYVVTLSMRMDVVQGGKIRDIKCSFRAPDDKAAYLDSMQWKIYLLSAGLDEFFYDHFHIKERVSGEHVIELLDPPLMCVRYPDMQKDVERTMSAMIAWCHRNNCIDLITSKF